MSDDEDIFDAVSPQQQIAPLPCVPPNQGPVSIPLSVLLDFAVQKVYQELTIKIQLLPNMSDLDRKVDIMQFAHKTRQLFVRLLAIVKWAKSAGKVDVCTAISCFLSQQCSYFVETADSLYQLSRENLSDARLPVFQIPAAVEVLTLGTYSRLPLSLRTRFVPDDPIKPKEQACVLQRLNQIIIYKLINQSQNLPVKYRIKNGVVTFRVENEFESSLTLLGETSDLPWTLLNLKILVEDYDIGEGTDLVHPQQVHYLHQVVQTRIEASSTPIIEMFNILHSFCLSLRLDVLCCQTSKLIYERLNDNVSIGEYRNGQKLVILYWKDMGGDLPVKTQSQPFTPIQYKIVIDIVTASNNMKTLRINHVPSSNADLPMVKDYEGENESHESHIDSKFKDCNRRVLNIENLLTDTQLKRVKYYLGQVKERLVRLLDRMTSDDCCQFVEKDALSPSLHVHLIDNPSDEEILSITINLFSGRYISDCVKLRSTNLLENLSQALNANSWLSLEQCVREMRLTLFVEKCKVSVANSPAKIFDYPFAISPLSFKPFPKHRIILKFPRYDKHLLVVAFDIGETTNPIVTKFYLTTFVYDDSSVSGTCSMMKIVNMTELNYFDSAIVEDEPLKKKCKLERCSETAEDITERISRLLSSCEQKIPFMLLCDYFTKKGVKFHLIHDEPEIGYSSLRIVGFNVYPDAENAKLLMNKLFSSVISCTVRLLLDKNRFQWNFEFYFHDVPFQTEFDEKNAASPKSKQMKNINRKSTRIASRNWPILQQLADGGAAKCVEEFLAVAYCYSKMDDLARKFRLVFQSHYIRNHSVIKSFTYHKLVLAYGPSKNYLAAVEYRFMDKCYSLSLGVTDRADRQSFDDSAPTYKLCKLCNPNSVIIYLLQQTLNRRGNLAQVMQILIETWPILAALQQLPHILMPLNADFLPSNCTQLPQQLLQQSPVGGPYSYLFYLVPISATVYRLMFRWTYCLEIVCLSQGKVALRDAKSCNSSINAKHASKLLPIAGLKSFISMYEKTLISVSDLSPKSKKNILLPGRIGITNESSKSSPAKASSTSELKLFSPSDGTMIATPSPAAAAVAPSPAAGTVGHSSQVHHGYHPTLSPANPFSQGSVQGVPASPAAPLSNAGLFSPSPAPLSNACMLMTPSPAGVGGPNSNFPQPSPAAPSSIGPSAAITSTTPGSQFYQQQPSSVPPQVHSPPPMTTSVPSPCSVLNEFAALSSDNKLPGSVEYPSSWGDLSGPPSAATPGEKDSSLRSSGVSLSTPTNPSVTMLSTLVSSRNVGQTPTKHSQSLDLSAYTKPIIIKHSTLNELCQKETNSGESSSSAPITKFLSTMAIFERLCRFDRPNQSMDIGQSNTSGTVVLRYLPFEYKFYVDDSTLSDLRLRVNELSNESKFTMDDLRSVEQYFAQFVAPMYNFNAIQSLLRLLMLSHKAHSSMLKSVLCLMKHQLNPHPEQGMMWRPSLCLLTPPLNMMIPPFVPALNSQLVLQPGSHAIVASQPGNKVLFWLKLTNVSNPENQVIFPLRYDGDSNEIQVFIANPGLFAQQQQTNNLQFVLINNVNNILKRQITAYQAVNECCMWPAIRDLSKNLELPSN